MIDSYLKIIKTDEANEIKKALMSKRLTLYIMILP
uniref:Uncharacterized protein n=1 Tax=Polysiphonia sertularioides TaxID=945028 RepID=A0A1Z1MGD0_9FLOR|nr:hypothetical protein [Polysiphonia sertularioides]